MAEENKNSEEWPDELMPRSSGVSQNEGTFMSEEKTQPTQSNQDINPMQPTGSQPQPQAQNQFQQPVKKKGLSTKAIVGIIVGIGCFIFAVIGILAVVILLALGQARSKSYDSKVKSTVEQLCTSEEVYYDNNQSYTSDFNKLMSNSKLEQPIHEGTDAYGISIEAGLKNYTIEGHLKNGDVYSCNDQGKSGLQSK